MAFQHAYESDGAHAGKVEVMARLVQDREKAIQIDDGIAKTWLPKSKISYGDAGRGLVVVLMPEWLAREKRFI